jgi:hypothetical protein
MYKKGSKSTGKNRTAVAHSLKHKLSALRSCSQPFSYVGPNAIKERSVVPLPEQIFFVKQEQGEQEH